jgi:hypothetical protein
VKTLLAVYTNTSNFLPGSAVPDNRFVHKWRRNQRCELKVYESADELLVE